MGDITTTRVEHPQVVELDPVYLHLRARADEYASEALAPNTRRTYIGEWRRFLDFCSLIGASPLPASPDTVRLYLGAQADEGRRPSGIDVGLAAIAHVHTRAGFPSPRTEASVLQVRRGIRRRLGTAPAPKAALTVTDLRAVCSPMGHAELLDVRDRAVLLLGWIGGFRPSELAGLRVDDLAVGEQRIEVRVSRSKTDQEGQGRQKTIPRGIADDTCPMLAVLRWLELLEQVPREERWLFPGARFGRLGHLPLSRRDIGRILKRRCLRAGMDGEPFSGVSLRSGFITAAVDAGKPLPVIMAQTWHRRPETLTRYVRSAALRTSAAEGLGL